MLPSEKKKLYEKAKKMADKYSWIVFTHKSIGDKDDGHTHSFMQYKSKILQNQKADQAKVKRNGRWGYVHVADIVFGDIVELKDEGEVPCDLLLISGQLMVSSYLEIMDSEHQEMFDFSKSRTELP